MKIHWAWLLVTAEMIGRFRERMNHMQQVSLSGQTLTDLSRALEGVKLTQGSYPETIGGLKVPTECGDYSEQILSRIKYYRTEEGYVAFVGLPAVALIQNRESPRFDR
jgi:hypothetical protein